MIYLDHNATTPMFPEVIEEMHCCCQNIIGNPSSIHSAGIAARKVIDKARVNVSRLIGARPEEIIFTSGGTEANNLALSGVLDAVSVKNAQIVTSQIEHQSVLNLCHRLKNRGVTVNYLPVDSNAQINMTHALSAINVDTTLISVMLANNDIGSIQPIGELVRKAHSKGAIFHTDAVQAVGKIPVNVDSLQVDLLSFSAHKLGGPKGVGALYVRKNTPLSAVLFGGNQEQKHRPGTENVAAIAGFGVACKYLFMSLGDKMKHLKRLRDEFEETVVKKIKGVTVSAVNSTRLPNVTHLMFDDVDGEDIVLNMDIMGVAVSTGSACSSGKEEGSHVLRAMGASELSAKKAIRVSFGFTNCEDDVGRVVCCLAEIVGMLRGDN